MAILGAYSVVTQGPDCDGSDEEDLQEQRKAFFSLEKNIPGVLSIRSGPDSTRGRRTPSYDELFWVIFTSRQARDDYLTHPAHQEFVKGFVPHVEEVLVVDFTVLPAGDPLTVTDGAAPFQVLPRGEDGRADLEISGICAENGRIQARVLKAGEPLAYLGWQDAGMAAAGRFSAAIRGLPAGGEYRLELRRLEKSGIVAEMTAVDHLLVGDLWLLAGQSNMYGAGDLVGVEGPDPRVHVFALNHSWRLAVEPLHWRMESPDPAHSAAALKSAGNERERLDSLSRTHRDRDNGAGLALPFAKEVVKVTGVPIGLIATAHGGTPISQWNPSGREKGGATLYGSMWKQVQRAGGHLTGILWYQGESDALEGTTAGYLEAFKELVAGWRSDLGNPELPIFTVQLGPVVADREVEEAWNAVFLVAAADVDLDDPIHLGTQGLKVVGGRLARLALSFAYGQGTTAPGPRPVRAVVDEGRSRVRLYLDGVNGTTLPATGIRGFSITDDQGRDVPIIVDAFVDPDDPMVVVIELSRLLPPEAHLWYGRGLNPAGNLTDSQDMAAPSFGPIVVGR